MYKRQALHNGDIAEMKTGEGKTLTSIFPVYLNALTGKGVHVITVNDYLAERDARNNGKVLEFLGLTVGLNKRELTPQQKQEAHGCDVTYTTNAELGFDYLRDNMVTSMEDKVLVKGLKMCIRDRDYTWSTEDIIDVMSLYNAVEKAYEEGISKTDFLNAYRKFKNVVGTKSEEKQIDKEFQDVSGYSIYKVFKASQENDWIKL